MNQVIARFIFPVRLPAYCQALHFTEQTSNSSSVIPYSLLQCAHLTVERIRVTKIAFECSPLENRYGRVLVSFVQAGKTVQPNGLR